MEMLVAGLKMVSREALLEGLLQLRFLVVGILMSLLEGLLQWMSLLGGLLLQLWFLVVGILLSLLEGLLQLCWFLVLGILPSMSLGPMVLPLVSLLVGLQQLWLRRNMDRMPQRSPPPAAPMIWGPGVETETEIAVAGGDQGRDLHHEPAV